LEPYQISFLQPSVALQTQNFAQLDYLLVLPETIYGTLFLNKLIVYKNPIPSRREKFCKMYFTLFIGGQLGIAADKAIVCWANSIFSN